MSKSSVPSARLRIINKRIVHENSYKNSFIFIETTPVSELSDSASAIPFAYNVAPHCNLYKAAVLILQIVIIRDDCIRAARGQ